MLAWCGVVVESEQNRGHYEERHWMKWPVEKRVQSMRNDKQYRSHRKPIRLLAASVGSLALSGTVTHLHQGKGACGLGSTLPVPAPMQLVDNETVRVRFSDSSVEYSSGGAQFLKQVSTLFESSSKSGSIWLTHKRRVQYLLSTQKFTSDFPSFPKLLTKMTLAWNPKVNQKMLNIRVWCGQLMETR